MIKSTSFNVSFDSDLVAETSGILETLGLSLNDAFNLMLHQIKIQKALPFEVIAYGYRPNAETEALLERIENGTAEMAGPFDTFEEFQAWVSDEDDDDDAEV